MMLHFLVGGSILTFALGCCYLLGAAVVGDEHSPILNIVTGFVIGMIVILFICGSIIVGELVMR